jgi:hypothetical protein
LDNAVSGGNFNGSVTITALMDISFTSFVLRSVVVEDTIIYGTAPGLNGETNFYQVMRKMLPDADGISLLPMLKNQTYTYNFSWAIETPCAASQLRTVAFIQDENTTKVWQSEITNSSITGIRELAANNILHIYPNPANDKLSIESLQKATIEILNIQGQIILQQLIQQGKTYIDISGLAKGVYILRLSNNDKTEVTRIIKE